MFAVECFTTVSLLMATFRINVQKHHLKSDGTYNIKIRVIHNRKVRYISTQYFESKSEFDKKLNFKSGDLRYKYEGIEKKYRDSFEKIADHAESMSVDEVVDFVKGDISKEGVFSLDIIAYGRKIAEVKSVGSRTNYNAALNSLSRYNEGKPLDISLVTTRLLEGWANWLQTDNGGKPVQGRGVSLYLGCLRAIHNEAKREFNDEDLGIINIKGSPFSRFKMPAMPITRKRALSVEQMRLIAAHQPTGVRDELAKDVFLLSFMLMGMNSADLYACDILKEDRIVYFRQKTASRRSDRAEMQVSIPAVAMSLIEKYRDADGQRVFCFYKRYSDKSTFNAALNKGLKQIGTTLGIDDLEFYAARHSWATIARNDCGIDQYTVHAALNHVDDKMRVTDIYIAKDWRPVNDANHAVMKYVFGEKK